MQKYMWMTDSGRQGRAVTGQLCDIVSGKNAEEEHRRAADERDAQAVPEGIPIHMSILKYKQACPLRHCLRNATSPKGRGFAFPPRFKALPLGELDAKRPERARMLIIYTAANPTLSKT